MFDSDVTQNIHIAMQKYALNTVSVNNTAAYTHAATATGSPGVATIGIILPAQDGLIAREQGTTHNTYMLTVTLRGPSHLFGVVP